MEVVFIMEYLEGGDLAEYLQSISNVQLISGNGPFDETKARNIFS